MIAVLATLALLLPVAVQCSSAAGVSSPLLLWSNQALAGRGAGQSVSYQVVADSGDLAAQLVLTAAGKADGAGQGAVNRLLNLEALKPQSTVVLFLGTQLDAADMRLASSPTSKLAGVLEDAASSVILPYALSQAPLSHAAVTEQLTGAGVKFAVAACGDSSLSVSDALAEALAGKAQVVVICSSVSDADDSTNAGLEAEVAQVVAVQEALHASDRDHVFVYASAPRTLPDQASNGKRRSLLQTFSGFGTYTTCGPLCQTQVRWLEGILAVLFLALASCAGLVCLYVLDTPTRFEVPKEGSS